MNKSLPSSQLVIRPASFTDIPFIRQIAIETWPSAYEALLGKEQVAYMLDWIYSPDALEKQMKEHHYFFLALKEYKPVGFASFSNVGKDIYKLQKLYVLPSQQKTGLGKKLLETVETVSKSMGGKILQLNVNRKNIAKAFYERNGFIVLKEEDIDIGSGYYMNDYVMEKDL
jgi:ribosomal protein S18 acetylase RimI-like enzyme